MKFTIKRPLVFSALLLWFGVFVTVSFIETPMKFQVPGMTLPIALELGKIMFGISTNIQLVLLGFVLVFLLIGKEKCNWYKVLIYGGILVVVLLQKWWMLPVLDERADLLAVGKSVPPSELHNYFIYSEVLKVFFLINMICFQLKRTVKEDLINSYLTL